MRYKQAQDGDTITPKMRGYKVKCCDCGLVHRFNFKVITKGRGKGVQFRVWRDERATAAVRRAFQSIRVIKRKNMRVTG